MHKYKEFFLNAFTQYFKTIHVSFGFALALITLVNLLYGINFSAYFGNLTYTQIDLLSFAYIIPTIVLCAFINSLFSTILIYLTKKNIMQETRKVYLLEFVKKHTTYVFIYNLVIYFLLFLIFLIFENTKANFLIPIFAIVLLFLNFYTIQSIIIDNKHVFGAISYGFFFLKRNIWKSVFILLFLTLIYFIIALISFYFSFGWIISIILYTIFFYPFSEILKTVFYLTKYDIVKSYF
jgi:hypothetical protein